MHGSKPDQPVTGYVFDFEAVLCLVNFDASFPWCCWIQPCSRCTVL